MGFDEYPQFTKDDAPSFNSEAEARAWAESLDMGRYGQVTCYINGRYTCIQTSGQCEDEYRGAIEEAITNFLVSCGLSSYSDTEEVGVDIAADATSMLYDYLERNNIMDMLWLYDSY